MYYVYVLKIIKSGRIYTGYTSNLRRRIEEHKRGDVVATRKFLPIELIYYEAFKDKKDAQAQEKYLKSGGKAKNDLKNRIKYSLLGL